MTITIEKLKELCEEYDSHYGAWPESKYEGQSVFLFIEEELVREVGEPDPKPE